MSKENNSMEAPWGASVEDYYKFHSRIYDLTRWTFLFGRSRLIEDVAKFSQAQRILEIGCGTGTNLLQLSKVFPSSCLTGVDLSDDMLDIARQNTKKLSTRVDFKHCKYDQMISKNEPQFDLVFFSYTLTMMNPGWLSAIELAKKDLKPGGLIAVVDFNTSPLAPFRNWMAFNHVQMEGQLVPMLKKNFKTKSLKMRPAYAGAWNYFTFIGQKII